MSQATTFDRLPIGVYRSTPEGKMLDGNAALLSLLGCPDRETLLAAPPWSMFPDPDERVHLLANADREGGARGIETQLRRMDGRLIQGRLSAFLARDMSGRPVSYVGTIEDVTDSIRPEETAKRPAQSLRHTRAVLESALDAILGMDAAGRITDWNARAEVFFGWPRKEALGREVADLIMPARYRESHRRGLQHLLSTGEGPILGRRVETIGLRRDGSEFPMELSVSAFRDGDVCTFNAFAADISERKRAEEALRDGEERYRALYERERAGREQAERLKTATSALGSTLGLPEVLALILRELQRVVAYDSASIQQLRGDCMEIIAGHGFSNLDGILGLRFDVTATDNPNREVFLTRRPVLLGDAPVAFPEFLAGAHAMTPVKSWIGVPLLFGDRLIGMLSLDKNQPGFYTKEHVRLAESFAAPAAIAMENARLFAAAREELEERKRVEDQFRQSQKMEAVGRLAGGIAHDFNNLLGVILGYTELAGHLLEEDNPARAKLQQVRKAAERAAALTGQLLAFSRKQVLVPDVLDLSEVIGELSTMLRRVIGEDVELVTVLHEGLGFVRADRGQIGQALLNLAVNARDAMPRGGKLIVHADNADLTEDYVTQHPGVVAGPYVMLAVSDTGTGIEAEVLSEIFEPFFTTKEHGKGTGLGLSMVYGFVEQSGGHVTVQSALGEGTTFQIYLPRLSGEVGASAPPEIADVPARGSETVLLVEDEDSLRDLIAEMLRGNGYHVLEAATAERALKVSQEHDAPIELLLTDVVMPGGMNGGELAERWLLLRPAARVLFMSGYTDDAAFGGGRLAEGAPLIQKPFTAADLLSRIRQALGRDH